MLERVVAFRHVRGVKVLDGIRVVHAVQRDRAAHGRSEDIRGYALGVVAVARDLSVTLRRACGVEVVDGAGVVGSVERNGQGSVTARLSGCSLSK